jgi:hypothetical protein
MGCILRGLAAGAVGTELLNVTTYLDVVVRGRPLSSVPEHDVEALTSRLGVQLGADPDTASNRKSGLGALLGYASGAGIGALYGLVHPLGRRLPKPLAAALAGALAMAATDAASTALGTTDPSSWAAKDWAADIVPHLAYGAGLVASYDAMTD